MLPRQTSLMMRHLSAHKTSESDALLEASVGSKAHLRWTKSGWICTRTCAPGGHRLGDTLCRIENTEIFPTNQAGSLDR